MARSIKSPSNLAGYDISGIIDDAFENSVFEPVTTEEIEDEIHLMAPREIPSIVYVHLI
jgi:hypothetical protein